MGKNFENYLTLMTLNNIIIQCIFLLQYKCLCVRIRNQHLFLFLLLFPLPFNLIFLSYVVSVYISQVKALRSSEFSWTNSTTGKLTVPNVYLIHVWSWCIEHCICMVTLNYAWATENSQNVQGLIFCQLQTLNKIGTKICC